MKFSLDTSKAWNYQLGLSGAEEILQNIRVILDTPKGSLPLDRDFGVDWSIVDSPTPFAIQKLKAKIVRAIEKYEPRVKVTKITSNFNEDGQVFFFIEGEIEIID